MQSKPNFFQKPINDRWQINSKLKSGGFGSVYLALDLANKKKEYAIKMIPAEGFRYAEIEQKMYALVQKQQFTNGFVKHYETGEFMKYKYLLMELIGKDLDQLKKVAPKQRFTLKTVLMIGLQVVDRLEALHKIGYLHRDVKPDNLAIGLAEKNKVIYIFDFGLALPIGQDIPKEEKGKAVGTLGFMSCRAHEGKQQGPSDDLQSLIYSLIYLVEGSLPWQKLRVQNTADFHKILLMKRDFAKKHGKGESQELIQILALLQNTKVDENVDYLQIKFRMLEAIKKRKMQNDFIFDWCVKTERLSYPSQEKKEADSPRKNKMIEIMNEQNQQLVQNEIYEVYKFMEGNKPNNQQNQAKPSRKSPLRNQPSKHQISKPKAEEKKEQKKRPASAALKPQPVQNQWEKIMLLEKSNMVSGPKIVINKTAKHKI